MPELEAKVLEPRSFFFFLSLFDMPSSKNKERDQKDLSFMFNLPLKCTAYKK